ncbi:hypothetical protein V5E97_06295 [Singulisphaera sp. Ch08]|uniref:Uncharacterized protein n=1 Tax=Singulisphaera sp. Ch08 TaxID=3120278 RepID=A0AAU7CKL5_9BACT
MFVLPPRRDASDGLDDPADELATRGDGQEDSSTVRVSDGEEFGGIAGLRLGCGGEDDRHECRLASRQGCGARRVRGEPSLPGVE